MNRDKPNLEQPYWPLSASRDLQHNFEPFGWPHFAEKIGRGAYKLTKTLAVYSIL